MPRKTKEQKELENENKLEKTAKKSATKKVAATKKKTTSTKKNTSKTSSAVKEKSATAKKKTSTTTAKKKTATKTAQTTKKSTAKKTTATKKEKVASKKSTTSRAKKKVEIVEYYDLPYRYNQTVVKVLAQTPNNLFIYWDISDADRKNFENQYGENFFNTTKPILIIHNNTLGYSFEVEINDFANSWYLHVADSKCDYKIELGRRPIMKTESINTDYIYITTSNKIEAPNDRILFDKNQKMVYFRNTKTGEQTEKPITSISFIRNMGKIYNIYDLYKAIYKDENIGEMFDLSNPSSGSLSSKFK